MPLGPTSPLAWSTPEVSADGPGTDRYKPLRPPSAVSATARDESFGQIVSAKDAFTMWFLEQVKAIHGVDLSGPMPDGGPSKQVVDSGEVPVAAR
jgi:hypothetical protein